MSSNPLEVEPPIEQKRSLFGFSFSLHNLLAKDTEVSVHTQDGGSEATIEYLPEVYPPPYEIGVGASIDPRYFAADYRVRLKDRTISEDEPPLRQHTDENATQRFDNIMLLVHAALKLED